MKQKLAKAGTDGVFNTGSPMLSTFVVHTQNKPDVLARVVLMFHRRALNIEALTLTRLKESDAVRITITVEADSEQSNRIEANLHKLVDVMLVENVTNLTAS
jgi:acetolactate synthase-1/3 small subunit